MQRNNQRVSNLFSLIRVKTLVRVPDERQAHLGTQIVALRRGLGPQSSTHIGLWDLVDREVLRVDVG